MELIHTCYRITDVDRSVAFYNALGFEEVGRVPIRDEAKGKDLRLNLIKVHEDKVSRIKKDDAYFACTDFITEDGAAKYDLDFWMKEGAGGALEVYMTKIHKKDGNPRFTYMEDEIVEVK